MLLSLLLASVSIPHRQTKNSQLAFVNLLIFVFQFLIGRLKTAQQTTGVLNFCEFQFLIGRLKTPPYLLFYYFITRFQFLIGRLKTRAAEKIVADIIEVSIPHRQTKNRLPYLNIFLIYDVSIPHRQTKNAGRGTRQMCRTEFQFLIGRLKTQKMLDSS